MDWETIRKRLETILDIPVTLTEERSSGGETEEAKGAVEETFLPAEDREGRIAGFRFGTPLPDKERELVELILEASRPKEKGKQASVGEEERKALLVRNWILQQLELGIHEAELPESLASQTAGFKTRIPLLLTGEFQDARSVSYRELKKLLDSFFDAEISLIPLTDREWLILGPETLLSESFGSRWEEEEEESLEDTLASICEGLYEVLSNEWVGECHLAVLYPMNPAKTLLSATVRLRETILLGKTFHVGETIHLPWKMRLEKLMGEIPDPEKNAFVRQVFKRSDPVLDAETLTTLESFFSQDCNVSETAKKLYIHRNTLLYRLDKFKQETGLDVRTFNDAVLVKLALLLYKVTKRQ